LESLVERLQDSKQVVLAEEKKSEVLRNVPVTPIFEDVTALTLLVNKLMDAEAGRIFSAAKLAAASGLAAIEAPAATEAIEKLTADLDLAAARVDELKREVADVGRQLTGAATELRELARDATCPTCGAALDAERLLAAGGGGHAHE
jgi:tetrahydromethanopterin S-methyltransferase subunit B